MASGIYRRARRARESGTGCAVSHVGMEMHSEVLMEPSGWQGQSLCAREDARLLGPFVLILALALQGCSLCFFPFFQTCSGQSAVSRKPSTVAY